MSFIKYLLKGLAIIGYSFSSNVPRPLNTLILPISFLSNLGRPISPVCNNLSNLIFDDSNNLQKIIQESSNDTLTLSKNNINYVKFNNNRYASTLGCIVDTFYNDAKNYYNSIRSVKPFDSYDVKILILPVSAGGGSCSRSQYYSKNYYSIIRNCDLPTLTKAVLSSFGLSKAVINNNDDLNNGDLSDPMGIDKYKKVMLLNPLNRLILGWLHKDSVKNYSDSINLVSSASIYYSVNPILVKGPFSNDIKTENFWISYRGYSNTTNDFFLPYNYTNCLFIHRINILEKKLCRINEEFINAETNTRIILKSIEKNIAKIEFLKCIQKQPTLQILSYKDTIIVSIFNNNNNYCDYTTTYKALFNYIPIGYNIDSINGTSRKISVNLVLDINPLEVSFEFSDDSGTLFSRPMLSLSSGIYSFIYSGKLGSEITFKIFDHGGDGICCQYGGGSYYQILIGDTVIHTGGTFGYVDTFKFTNNPVMILKNIYPQQLMISKNLTLFKPNNFTNIVKLTIFSINSKTGYGILQLPIFNFTAII
jgi:hypothetical protein